VGEGWRLRRQEGSQALELVALLPLLVTTALVLWQFALTGYTLIVAETAVRDAGRAAAAGQDPVAAARLVAGDLPVTVDPPSYAGDAAGCQVSLRLQVEVPLVALPFLRGRSLSIARQAIMPAAAGLCP